MAGNIRLDQAIQSAAALLQDVTENPRLDAQILLACLLDRERSWLLAHPEYALDEETQQKYNRYVDRVRQGEAVPYVTGERWFFGRKFAVEPAVLIPRPETELLVEAALDFLRSNPEKRRVVDVGTGSGCIAVTLSAELSDLKMFATDRSHQALKVARRNALRHKVEDKIQFWLGDLLGPVEGTFDLICANLPYIPSSRLASLAVAKREPTVALNGGADGLEYIAPMIQKAETYLGAGGRMILEIDESQGDSILDLVASMHPDWSVSLIQDLAGLDRLVILEFSSHGR